ncbi:uncharacterized protein LOC119767976 [Culex quinquefasciatus]|uniref:uncharacterized protein LOC119767976 n=1 Tax=Culex quinquefasciatus TaxID=7176 RepID=UPI0018E354FB|nr:uncharacterized protein LOC119767976 [Culex quinquefasciatus]
MAPVCDNLSIEETPGPSRTASSPPSIPSSSDMAESTHDFVLLSDDESIEVLDNESDYAPEGATVTATATAAAVDQEESKHLSFMDGANEDEKESLKKVVQNEAEVEAQSEIDLPHYAPTSMASRYQEEPKTIRHSNDDYGCCEGNFEEEPPLASSSQFGELTTEQQLNINEQNEDVKSEIPLPEVIITEADETIKSEEGMTESVLSGSTAVVEQLEADDTIVEGAEQVIPEEPKPATAKIAEIPVIAYFSSSDGKEYVRVEQQMPWKVDQLNCAARLANVDLEIRLHNEGCLLLVDENFVAKVRVLDLAPVTDSTNFIQAKTMLFWQLRIVRILQDELMADRDRSRTGLLTSINRIRNKPSNHTNDAIQLLEIIQSSEDLDYRSLCEKLRENTVISASLREQATQLLQLEDGAARRNRFLNRFHVTFTDDASGLGQTLEQFRVSVIDNHIKSLLEKAPEYLQTQLKEVPETILIRISVCDIKVFHDMDHVLNPDIFKDPLQDLAKRWIKHVRKSTNFTGSLTNPVYFSLCRSLEELILEITSRSSHTKEALLKSDKCGWHPLKTIHWSSPTDFTKCLEREYQFIMKLLKHFDPASGNTKPFDYQPRRLIDCTTATESVSTIGKIFRRLFRHSQANPLGIADEFYAWYCMLDDALAHLLPNRDNKLDVFEHVLQNYVLLISNATIDQMETIRVITHNTLRFIVQTVPFLDPEKANSCEDKQILQLQLDTVNRLVTESQSTNSFRDLIDVFSRYWENRSTVIENIPSKQAIPEMEQIKTNLFTVVLIALQKNVSAERLVDFFRTYNDFLIDLDNVSFDWLIKPISMFKMDGMINMKIVELVETKWSKTDIATYRVINPKKFTKLINVLAEDGDDSSSIGPKHYIVEIITKLLGNITSQLQHSRWTSGTELTDHEQIESATVLISAIRSSLLYLQEQAEYVSYDLFLDESLKPFSNVSENSESSSDFTKRIGLIKESFYFFRRQNEMSMDEALKMFRELNVGVQSAQEPIVQAYKHYTEHFEKYMLQTIPEITAAILSSKKSILFKNWTPKYKQETLPQLLAGITAVWSIMASKDVSGTGKYLKPHCIQVLCVLRLLGVDNVENGVAKHLAQVLTGQGKSLVLGLIATVLALTGHNIQVVCYNKYLVERDAQDFQALFNAFGVPKVINYSTYDGMANLVLSPEVDGKPVKLRLLVEDLLVSGTNVKGLKKPASQIQDNSVMLMDEVDVFFSRDYYGNGYYPVATPEILGLDKIQEKIWNLVRDVGLRTSQDIFSKIITFINTVQFEGNQGFNKFYNKPGSYDILEYENSVVVRKTTTNKALFEDHLNRMITDAINVVVKPSSHWMDYRLNPNGLITCKYNERFVNFFKVRYFNVFNYFRLKKQDFVKKIDIEENYGYLNIRCGSLSYAMLPKNFPLILGVTGTLTTLNQHEKDAIDRLYNIRQSSVMPTFFGCSNMQFDPLEHFHAEVPETRWMGEIFTRAHAAIASKRAVIVFFQDESSLEKFQSEYAGQFDRLNVLTENTDEQKQEQLITEAGVAKTVTLATRGMGRGVDFKSSVSVEKNGGVHVIQTFFSLDVKEETQIRGRTARKDNKGSYELIVCEEHLKQQGLFKAGETVSYASIDAERTKLALAESKDVAELINKESGDHHTTMNYLQSFFK